MRENKLQVKVQINHLEEWQRALSTLEKAAAEMQTALDQLSQLEPMEIDTISRRNGAESIQPQLLPASHAKC